ncbi:MAG: hypothetical protein PHG65_11730, partial [Kiritimatiellae bacterium]|nr:hypothetical protein [Kiritimatiellia bacterium]
LLVKYTAMNQRAIGKLMNMGTGSAVSQQIRRLRVCQAGDSLLAAEIRRLEQAVLSNLKG